MASSIAPVTQLVTLIKTQLNSAAPAQKRNGLAMPRATAAVDEYAAHKLGGVIQLRVKQIAHDDPQRGRKAFRVFLEAVLLSHFGDALANDPKFYQVLDDIQSAMENDTASAVLVERAIGHLLAQE